MSWITWDRNLKIRLLGETLFNMLFWMYFPFLTIYFSESIGVVEAGFMMTAPAIISIFGGMIGGYFADEYGRRNIMILGSFMQAMFFALFALSVSPWIDYIAFVGISLGKAFYRPASSAMVADLVSEKERRNVFATFASANNIGAIFGPFLGAVLFFQYRTELLWSCTFIASLYFGIILLLMRETMLIQKSKKKTTALSVIKNQWKSYFHILKDKVYLYYIVGGMFITISIMQLDLYLALYVKNYVPAQQLFSIGDWSFSLNSEQIFGWMIGLNGLLFVLLVIPITKRINGWSDRNALVLAASLSGIGMFSVGLSTNIWLLFILTVIFTIGEIIHGPVVQNFVVSYAPKSAIGQYIGASDLQYSFGRFIAPFTVILSSVFPPMFIFGFILLCACISTLFYIRMFNFIDKEEIGT
ncbi:MULTISPECIES: MFS transporter [unclassified Oceanobacillus]|uniref:MDR family MFS transporter n=1 Tax=unclassified Oceanobacillus TaxID=2630292 RepID=UPI001BE55B55|nr:MULTISPECIES: MFS transporter [unclassified Oceanobacillus]MBT2601388.1 MFS transporter [Oceanobacillus sp. ISL-74]MBT2653447.1 MFS transporter [Oceanobacillus sp. ISL-73]